MISLQISLQDVTAARDFKYRALLHIVCMTSLIELCYSFVIDVKCP